MIELASLGHGVLLVFFPCCFLLLLLLLVVLVRVDVVVMKHRN